eukprot:9259074-Ditylum_brightwellii.AAC.1
MSDEDKYPKLESYDYVALLQHVDVNIEEESHQQWKQDSNQLPGDFVTLVESLEVSLVFHVPDMLGAVNSQSGIENLEVELGGDIFKGEARVRA